MAGIISLNSADGCFSAQAKSAAYCIKLRHFKQAGLEI
jgi:hypothetical protein